MTHHELNQLVALGEGAHLEFKRKVPRPERIAKEVIAFANTRGGRLLLGVDDDGTIVGVRDPEEEEFALKRALSAHCSPALRLSIERIYIKHRRDVIVVHVPESSEKPHFLVNGGKRNEAVFIRVDDKSVEASTEALELLAEGRDVGDVQFEFGEKELLLMRYLDAYGKITVPQYANVAGIPRRLASSTLVLLTRARILRLHADAKQDFFTLAY